MSKVILGSFEKLDDAKALVDSLLEKGVPKGSISMIMNKDIGTVNVGDENDPSNYYFHQTKEITDRDAEDAPGCYYLHPSDDGVWEHVKEGLFFHDQDEKKLDDYKKAAESGKILVVIDEDRIPASLKGEITEMIVWIV